MEAEKTYQNKVPRTIQQKTRYNHKQIVQQKIGFEFEMGDIQTKRKTESNRYKCHKKGDIIETLGNYNITADIGANDSHIEFVTKVFDENKDTKLIKQTGEEICNNISKIVTNCHRNNNYMTPANDKDYYYCNTRKSFKDIPGQLQITAGINLDHLPACVSGVSFMSDVKLRNIASKYIKQIGDIELSNQPLFNTAMKNVQNIKQNDDGIKQVLASIISLMAQIPLNARNAIPEGQGQFLARTDYSKILHLLASEKNTVIDYHDFLTAFISTLNEYISIKGKDSVFPEDYKINGNTLTEVKIKDWIQNIIPKKGLIYGFWKGTDMITKANYPNRNKAEILRPFGGYGNKTDPGEKIIIEWRNLDLTYPDYLAENMELLTEYIKSLQ